MKKCIFDGEKNIVSTRTTRPLTTSKSTFMKILHTSDWHLGHTLHDHDREEEQRDFLHQLVAIIDRERPEAMVVCGDIFDRPQPPLWARELYTETLLKIHDCYPTIQMVIMAGNHDSKSSLQLEGKVWERLNIRVVGQVERNADGSVNLSRHIVPVKDSDGQPLGYIVAVPHIYESAFPVLSDDVPQEKRQAYFYQALLDEAARQNPQGLPVVLTAHTAVTGSNFAGHDFNNYIGGIDTVEQDTFGTGYDYLALGHIHQPQTLSSNGPAARYCGTPLTLHFDEHGNHGVTMINLIKNQKPDIQHIPIKNRRPLLTIPQEAKPFNEVIAEIEDFPADEKAYLRLHVLLNGPMPPNYIVTIQQALQGKAAEYCCIKTELPEQKEDTKSAQPRSFEPDNMPTPLEMAKIYYQNQYHEEMDQEMVEMLEEAIRRVQKNNEKE